MVHALDEVWRILQLGGMLVDLRPRVANPHVQVLTPTGTLHAGRIDDSSDLPDVIAADRAISHAIDNGWFVQLEQTSFLYDFYWDTADEMYEYIQANWDWVVMPEEVYQEAKRLAQSGGTDCQMRIRIPMDIASYRKV